MLMFYFHLEVISKTNPLPSMVAFHQRLSPSIEGHLPGKSVFFVVGQGQMPQGKLLRAKNVTEI